MRQRCGSVRRAAAAVPPAERDNTCASGWGSWAIATPLAGRQGLSGRASRRRRRGGAPVVGTSCLRSAGRCAGALRSPAHFINTERGGRAALHNRHCPDLIRGRRVVVVVVSTGPGAGQRRSATRLSAPALPKYRSRTNQGDNYEFQKFWTRLVVVLTTWSESELPHIILLPVTRGSRGRSCPYPPSVIHHHAVCKAKYHILPVYKKHCTFSQALGYCESVSLEGRDATVTSPDFFFLV